MTNYYRQQGLGFRIVLGVEELLEMLGASLFVLGAITVTHCTHTKLNQ